jgi:hypothetical protein
MESFEAFTIEFTKLVEILDLVLVDKFIDIDAFVDGNSALATAKGEAAALGFDTHTETLSLTTTTTVAPMFPLFVGASASSSIAESLSVASPF